MTAELADPGQDKDRHRQRQHNDLRHIASSASMTSALTSRADRRRVRPSGFPGSGRAIVHGSG